MAISTNTKAQLEITTKSGVKFKYRPMTAWEKATWSSVAIGQAGDPVAQLDVLRNPIVWCAESWEGLVDADGNEVKFPKSRKQIDAALANVDHNILIVFAFAIIAASNLTESDAKNSDSAPSNSAGS